MFSLVLWDANGNCVFGSLSNTAENSYHGKPLKPGRYRSICRLYGHSWQLGEQLADRRGLFLPSDMPPGSYHLRVGLYRLSDGSRLLTGKGADGLDLGPFSVTANE